MASPPRRPRTLSDAKTEAEAAFKSVTAKVPEAVPKKAAIPGVKELVSIRMSLNTFRKAVPAGRIASMPR